MQLHPPAPTGELAADKAAWRTALQAARRELVAELGPAGRSAQAEALAHHAVALVSGYGGGPVVTAYQPLRSEPPVDLAVQRLLAVGARVLLPVTLPASRLDWVWADGGGTGEDVGAALGPEVLAEVDVALLPALAVDRSGRRIGKGGGYYDRALPLLRPGVPRVAVLHDHELVESLPAGPLDAPVDAVLTAAYGVRWLTAEAPAAAPAPHRPGPAPR